MDCGEVRERFLAPVVIAETGPWREQVTRHLDGCGPCRAEAEALARTWALLDRWPDASPAEAVRGRLRRRIRRRLLRDAVLSVPPVLAAGIAVGLSLALSLLIPYPVLVSLCRAALRVSEAHAAPYLVAGVAYGLPMAVGVLVLRRRAPLGALAGSLDAALLFVLILTPWVFVQCRDFAPLPRAVFLSGLGAGAVAAGLAGLGLARWASA